MASRNSRSSRSNKSARPSSRRLHQSSTSSSWFRRFGTRNLVIVAVFILAFAAIGGYYIHKSYAYSCIYTTLRVGSTGWCVTKLQDSLGVTHNFDHIGFAPGVDGIYGYNETYWAVYDYQHDYLGQAHPGGIVISISSGGQTWGPLCSNLASAYRYYKYAGLSGWRDRASGDFNGLGCTNYTTL